jgi:hypothetical protein
MIKHVLDQLTRKNGPAAHRVLRCTHHVTHPGAPQPSLRLD